MNFGENVPAVDAADVPDGAYLLDVRQPEEWQAGHVADAVHIPMGALSERVGELPEDKDIYVICRSGARSAQVTQALNNGGWTARNVSGGMQAWEAAGRPIVADSGAPFVA